MTDAEGVLYRVAHESDAQAVAALHADSWRRHYRGAYSDAFLDADVFSDRLAVWAERLRHPQPDDCTIVAAHDAAVIGFAHTILNEDRTWGALLENLHVTYALKHLGVGTALLAATAATVIERTPSSGVHLWVLEQNTAAQRFYEARGGARVGRRAVRPPGGDPARLNGEPWGYRYAWRDPSVLLSDR